MTTRPDKSLRPAPACAVVSPVRRGSRPGPAELLLSPIITRHMKHLFDHFIQGHVIPLLLIPVVLSGLSCFAIFGLPQALRSSSRTDAIILIVISLLGIIGTIGTWVFLRAVRSRPHTWQVFNLGRTAWSFLISVTWLAGVLCGVLIML